MEKNFDMFLLAVIPSTLLVCDLIWMLVFPAFPIFPMFLTLVFAPALVRNLWHGHPYGYFCLISLWGVDSPLLKRVKAVFLASRPLRVNVDAQHFDAL